MQHSRVLKKTDTCTMWQVHDRFAGMEYVECWGQFDNGYYFLIRSPLESIKESASISNSFLLHCRNNHNCGQRYCDSCDDKSYYPPDQ